MIDPQNPLLRYDKLQVRLLMKLSLFFVIHITKNARSDLWFEMMRHFHRVVRGLNKGKMKMIRFCRITINLVIFSEIHIFLLRRAGYRVYLFSKHPDQMRA